MKQLTLEWWFHVDAGKTTLSESILYDRDNKTSGSC